MKITTGEFSGGNSVRQRTGKQTASRRGRPSPERSTQITASLLRVAERMFFAEGYEGTSMEAVAREVGVPKTTLYKRFPDKNELLKAVIDHCMTSWAAQQAGQSTPPPASLEAGLTRLTETMVVWATKPEVRAIHRLVANLPDAHDSGFIGKSFWGYRNMFKQVVNAITELGPREGFVTDDPEGLADVLMAMIAGWVINNNTTDTILPEEGKKLAARFVGIMLRGKEAW